MPSGIGGYYQCSKRDPSARTLDNQRLVERTRESHEDSDAELGACRMCEDLGDEGEDAR